MSPSTPSRSSRRTARATLSSSRRSPRGGWCSNVTGKVRPSLRNTGQSPRKADTGPGSQRRRHHQDAQVVPPGLAHLRQQRQREVGVERALVELVEHHDVHVLQEGVVLEAAREQPLREHLDARVRGGPILEADAVADLMPEAPALLRSDASRRRSGSHPAGLEQGDATRRRQPRGQQCGRHPGGLARARGSDQHRSSVLAQGGDDIGEHGIDGERLQGGASSGRPGYPTAPGGESRTESEPAMGPLLILDCYFRRPGRGPATSAGSWASGPARPCGSSASPCPRGPTPGRAC